MWRNNSGQYNAAQLHTAVVRGMLNQLRAGHVHTVIGTLETFLENERWVRYGVGKGGSDLIGINQRGRFLAFEVKEGPDKLSTEQALFLKLVNDNGGYATEIRSESEALTALENSLK
jgi:hypothetical protein